MDFSVPGYCIDCFFFPIEQHKDKNICRLSIELLDTEDTHSEDPVEVEVRPVTRLPIHFQTEKYCLTPNILRSPLG